MVIRNPDDDEGPENFKGMSAVTGQRQLYEFADNSKGCRRIMKFFGVGFLTSNKSFDFDADSKHHPYPGILAEFLLGLLLQGKLLKMRSTP